MPLRRVNLHSLQASALALLSVCKRRMGSGAISLCYPTPRSWLTKRYVFTSSLFLSHADFFRSGVAAYTFLHIVFRAALIRVQSEYANKLLFIATLALAKLSIISLLRGITASYLHRFVGLGLTLFIALWGIISVTVGALQCGAGEPWRFIGEGTRCSSLVCVCHSRAVVVLYADGGHRPGSGEP